MLHSGKRFLVLAAVVTAWEVIFPREAFAFDPCADASHINFVYNQDSKLCDCEGAVKTYQVNSRDIFECVPNSATAGVLSQQEAQAQAMQVNKLGSTAAASIAIGICAKGANKVLKNKPAGGLLIGNCLDSVVAAERLKEAELKGAVHTGQNPGSPELTPDPEKLKEAETAKHLKEMNENYGMSQEEFVKRTLATGGNQKEFGKLLRPLLSLSDYNEAMQSAQRNGEHAPQRVSFAFAPKPVGEEGEKPINQAGSMGGDHLALRDSLREGLNYSSGRNGRSSRDDEDDDESTPVGMRKIASLGAPQRGLEQIVPLNTSGVMFAAKEEFRELTLFDVVHRKYQEKEFMKRLFHGAP